MFRNIFYDSKRSVIHLWEQVKGENFYFDEKWAPYVYELNDSGYVATIDGKNVSKKVFDSYDEYYEYQSSNRNIFENNVRPEIQFLAERYHGIPDTEIETPKLKIYSLDIECYSETEFPTAEKALYPIVLISIFDNINKTTHTFSTRKYTGEYNKESWFDFHFFETEKEMLQGFFNWIKRFNCDVLTGWNCIDPNEYIFLNNKIVKLKNCKKNDNIDIYGRIEDKWETGPKEVFDIITSFGNKLCTSGNHIFPVYYKQKIKYADDRTLIKNYNEITVDNILQNSKIYDQYLRIDRNVNKNNQLTYKDLFSNNIEILVDRGLNFILPENVKVYLNENYSTIVKARVYNIIDRKYHKTSNLWNYKNFSDVLNIDDLKKFFKDIDSIDILFNVQKKTVFLNEEISNEDMYLLGLVYTDGTLYKNVNGISNTDIGIITGIIPMINKYRESKYGYIGNIKSIQRKNKKYKKQYSPSFSYYNIFGLLNRTIYNKLNKKNICIELLSQFSYSQICSFISGCIDGDGSVTDKGIFLCNYNNDSKKIGLLLQFNGFIPCYYKNGVSLKSSLNGLSDITNCLFHSKKKNIIIESTKKKNRFSKKIRYIDYGDFVLVKIKNVERTNKIVDMVDISTSTKYFLCNGIKTHNCIKFDLQYIINRTKNLFGEDTYVFANLSPIRRVRTWVKNGEFQIDIAGCTILDYMDLYKWYSPTKLERYTLDFVSKHELEKGKLDYSEYNNLTELYNKNWNLYVEYNVTDVHRVAQLEDKCGYIKLVQSLSLLTKAPMRYYNAMTSLLEGMFLTYFRRNSLCAPYFAGGTQESYPAAIVKEPVPDLYQWVIDLDITSSYPSHIITLNMSVETFYGRIKEMSEDEILTYVRKGAFPDFYIETVNGVKQVTGEKLALFNKAIEKKLLAIAPCGTVFTTTPQGIIAILEKYLFEKRAVVRDEIRQMAKSLPDLRDSDLENTKAKMDGFNSLQKALKIILNAAYGITAVPYSRYFNTNIAEAIVSCGRQTILGGERFANKILNHPNDDLSKYLQTIKEDLNRRFANEG